MLTTVFRFKRPDQKLILTKPTACDTSESSKDAQDQEGILYTNEALRTPGAKMHAAQIGKRFANLRNAKNVQTAERPSTGSVALSIRLVTHSQTGEIVSPLPGHEPLC